MLILVLAESALETIPKSLWAHPSIQRYARLHGKLPNFVLLDRSYHHEVMKRLEHSEKKGRPDIVHFTLLEALGSPLNKEGLLKVYVHTINDFVITVKPATRLPRNCNRFVSLIEQLFESGKVPPQPKQKALLTLKHQTLPQLIQEINPSYILALSRIGRFRPLEETIAGLCKEKRLMVFVGGFPAGHFSESTVKLADEIVCIDPEMLETWTVTSRLIYEFEQAISLLKKRLTM